MENEFKGYDIIIRGIFDPRMFYPDRLFKHRIENPINEQSVQKNIISGEHASFRINMTQYYIDKNKFQISSENIGITELLDNQLTKLFCNIYKETQANSFSIVKYIHIELENNFVN